MYSIALTIIVVNFYGLCIEGISVPIECDIDCPTPHANLTDCKISCPTDPSNSAACERKCKDGIAQCGFDHKKNEYMLFNSRCALVAYSKCHGIDFVLTPLQYCTRSGRRFFESCPVFCPNYYAPVCGASKHRSYVYRTFNNGCYLDMINCRGDEDTSTYVEVPLEFCQNHLMKNMFKEQVVVSQLHDYEDYE